MSFNLNQDMKRVAKIMTLLVAISAFWIGLLLQTSMVPRSYTWLLPLYFLLSLGCYGLLMVGVGLMQFRTCPQEAVLLQQARLQLCRCLSTTRGSLEIMETRKLGDCRPPLLFSGDECHEEDRKDN
ncbi:hypothetical protein RHSIM_Rhsim13G0047700 [Rhododendron simsii]|uniref:Dolichol-phosphate mannosyltransferase subunit 3 n=1 Tax=Rhododendron simsii TaxID=118357 RepID=A0A834G1U4_RHOSS|nr:hypothetical protein RHSIM_Rhsim13G0047700 [Rhododendron simsii]